LHLYTEAIQDIHMVECSLSFGKYSHSYQLHIYRLNLFKKGL